jgi:hypothetical protein
MAEFSCREISRVDRHPPLFSDYPRSRQTISIECVDNPLDGRKIRARQTRKFARVTFLKQREQDEYIRAKRRSEGSRSLI